MYYFPADLSVRLSPTTAYLLLSLSVPLRNTNKIPLLIRKELVFIIRENMESNPDELHFSKKIGME